MPCVLYSACLAVVETEEVVEHKPGRARGHQVEHLRKLLRTRLTLRLPGAHASATKQTPLSVNERTSKSPETKTRMPPLGDGCASQVVICVRVGGVSGVRSRRESADCSSGGARRHLVLARLEGQADQLLHDGVPALRGAAERARARVSRRSERLSSLGPLLRSAARRVSPRHTGQYSARSECTLYQLRQRGDAPAAWRPRKSACSAVGTALPASAE